MNFSAGDGNAPGFMLLDGMGRDLWLEARYKKEEAKVVDLLGQLADRLKREPFLSPVFFGIVYRESDRLKLYPIEFFTEWGEKHMTELLDDMELALTDLMQSGFSTGGPDAARRLRTLSQMCEDCGLHNRI